MLTPAALYRFPVARPLLDWDTTPSSPPNLSMEQSVTESDQIVVERIFRQRRNVRDSASLFFSIVCILESVYNVCISIEMDTDIVESRKPLP